MNFLKNDIKMHEAGLYSLCNQSWHLLFHPQTQLDYKKSLYQTTAIHIQFISFSVSELLHLNTPHYDRHWRTWSGFLRLRQKVSRHRSNTIRCIGNVWRKKSSWSSYQFKTRHVKHDTPSGGKVHRIQQRKNKTRLLDNFIYVIHNNYSSINMFDKIRDVTIALKKFSNF